MKASVNRLFFVAVALLTAARLVAAGVDPEKMALPSRATRCAWQSGRTRTPSSSSTNLPGPITAARNRSALRSRASGKPGNSSRLHRPRRATDRLVLELHRRRRAERHCEIVGAKYSVTVEVLSVTGDGVEEFTFVDVPLTSEGAADEPFAACALALNLQTNVRELPGRSRAGCARPAIRGSASPARRWR